MGLLGDVVYRPGYSFRNAPLARPVTRVRRDPWFYSRMAGGPLTKRAKLQRWTGGTLNEYRAVWRRGKRQMRADKLGHALVEVPDYQELGLGQAPGPTNALKTTTRSFWGTLENVLTKGVEEAEKFTATLEKREADRIASAQAQIDYFDKLRRAQDVTSQAADMVMRNWPIAIGAVIIGGVVVYNMAGRRK